MLNKPTITTAKMPMRIWAALHASSVALRILQVISAGVVLTCFTAVLLYLYLITHVRFSQVEYRMGNEEPLPASMPFYAHSSAEFVSVTFTMEVPRMYPRVFKVVPDDCIESMIINNQTVESEALPLCPQFLEGHIYDLHEYLHPGLNTMTVVLRDSGGMAALAILPKFDMPFFVIQTALYLLAVSVAILMPWKKPHGCR